VSFSEEGEIPLVWGATTMPEEEPLIKLALFKWIFKPELALEVELK
jgi:hypothetical protein